MTSLFVSYSRKDIDCARRLTEAFKDQGFDFWIDWEGIPPTVDWWNEIERGIEQVGVFLFLVSPNSLRSKVCRQEIDHALKNGKRLIPVVVRDVNAEEAPSVLSHLNWIFIRENDDFNAALGKLITAIKTDYDWVKTHRELQVKALEWDRSKHDKSFLLRGTELQFADFQLRTNSLKDPHPTDLQQEYVLKSRQAVDKQRRIITSLAIGVVIALAVLGAFGWINAGEAKEQAIIAQTAQKQAERQRLTAESNAILGDSNGDTELAVLLSLRALQGGYIPAADTALAEGLNRLYTRWIFDQHKEVVRTVAFSPTGDHVLIGYTDGTADLYDARSYEQIKNFEALDTYTGPEGNSEYSGVITAEFSNTGNYLLVATSGGLIRIWDQKTGTESDIDLKSDQYQDVKWEILWSAKFSPDEKYILVGTGYPHSDKGNIYLFERATGILKLTFPERHTRFVSDVEFSPDGKLILSTSFNGSAILWDMDWKNMTATPHKTIKMPTGIRDAAFFKDGTKILFGTDDGVATLLDTDGNIIKKFYGHTSSVFRVAFHPSGNHILTASWDHTARLWDINTTQVIRTYANHSDAIWSAALSPDGKYLLTGSHDKTARLWIADPTYETRSIHDYSGIISFLPDGNRILSSDSDGTVWIWNVETLDREKLKTIGTLQATSTTASAQGQWIATRSSDNTITIWKNTGGRYEEAGKIPMEDMVTSLNFSPSIDGKESEYLLIGAGSTWSAELYKVGPWNRINSYMERGWVTSVRFSPDGKFIAIGTKTDISIKDIFVDEPEITCNQDTSSIAFSKDGKYLAATAGYDVVLLDWQNPSGCTLFKELTGHTAGIGSIEFSPDGRYLLSASGDGTAKLWETNTWTVFKTLIGHEGAVLGGAFSPDSSLVVTGGEDHAIRFWDMDYMTTIQSACDLLQSLQRDLSSDERNHYGITDTSPTCSK